jgi:general secretion pathway protein D
MDVPPALDETTAAAAETAAPPITGSITEKELAETRKPQPPQELKGKPGLHDLDFRGNSKQLFEQVSRVYGLDVVFDGDYPDAAALRFRMGQADYREALRTLEIATGSFVVPLTDRLMLVVKDTVQKRHEVEPMAAVVVPIPEPVSLQDAQELARTVQQTFEIRRFFVDSARRLVFLRDRVSKIEGAQMLFAQLLHHRPEVEIEVEFIEVSRKAASSYGISLPMEFPLVNVGKLWRNATPYFPSGFTNFIPFGGGASLLALGIGNASLMANASRSDGSVLLRANLRAMDSQPASFHAGDKYPISTSRYVGDGSGSDTLYTPQPTITFEDLGLVLKITPRIHGAEEVTMDVEAEFKVLTGESLNDIPVIANRKLKSQIRVASGEYAVIAGLMNASEARTVSGLAGISSLPWLGPLLRKNSRDEGSNEAVIVIRPRVISLPGSERPTKAFWTGSETRYPSPL